jgi:hypothetical protein
VETGDFAKAMSRNIGYSDDQLVAVPEGANLGVGCGNPTPIDALDAVTSLHIFARKGFKPSPL